MPEGQSSIDNLHQTAWGTELTDGDLTLPEGVNITAQEHFDIAQTGAYKVVAESYILQGKVVTWFCGLIRIRDVGKRLDKDNPSLWNIDFTAVAHQKGFNSASAHVGSDMLEERVRREQELRRSAPGCFPIVVNRIGRGVTRSQAVGGSNGKARVLVEACRQAQALNPDCRSGGSIGGQDTGR